VTAYCPVPSARSVRILPGGHRLFLIGHVARSLIEYRQQKLGVGDLILEWPNHHLDP